MRFYGDVAAFEKRLAACEADLRNVCQDYVALEREMVSVAYPKTGSLDRLYLG